MRKPYDPMNAILDLVKRAEQVGKLPIDGIGLIGLAREARSAVEHIERQLAAISMICTWNAQRNQYEIDPRSIQAIQCPQTRRAVAAIVDNVPCPHCQGFGFVDGVGENKRPCSLCSGTGTDDAGGVGPHEDEW